MCCEREQQLASVRRLAQRAPARSDQAYCCSGLVLQAQVHKEVEI